VLSGVAAELLVQIFGLAAPTAFGAALLLLQAGAVVGCWVRGEEGDEDNEAEEEPAIEEGPAGGEGALLVGGVVQGGFEGAMLTFIGMWAPRLKQTGAFESTGLTHGRAFALLMLMLMLGSALSAKLTSIKASHKLMLAGALGGGALWLLSGGLGDDWRLAWYITIPPAAVGS